MWFRVLALVIAVSLLGKAVVALVAPRRFYAARQRQYASAAVPLKLAAAPIVVFALTLASWYAMWFHPRPWGWIVTGFLTLLSCMAVDHLVRWPQHRAKMLVVVSSSRVWQVDCLLLATGLAFAGLAMLVY